jgi:hypothetical protein
MLSSEATGEEGFQMDGSWREAVNTLHKQSQTIKKGWSSSSGFGVGAKKTAKKNSLLLGFKPGFKLGYCETP